jgi:hypothetical protein
MRHRTAAVPAVTAMLGLALVVLPATAAAVVPRGGHYAQSKDNVIVATFDVVGGEVRDFHHSDSCATYNVPVPACEVAERGVPARAVVEGFDELEGLADQVAGELRPARQHRGAAPRCRTRPGGRSEIASKRLRNGQTNIPKPSGPLAPMRAFALLLDAYWTRVTRGAEEVLGLGSESGGSPSWPQKTADMEVGSCTARHLEPAGWRARSRLRGRRVRRVCDARPAAR